MTDYLEKEHAAPAPFELWKAAVGLPKTFPDLPPISNESLTLDRLFYAGPRHADKLDEILTRASGALVYVRVSPGHGCTTLSRFIFLRLLESALRRRMIPVRLALDDVSPRQWLTESLDVVQGAMRRNILRSVAHDRWDQVLTRTEYIGVRDATNDPTRLENTGGASNAVDPRGDEGCQRHLRLVRPVPTPALISFDRGSRVDELLARLSTIGRIRVSLQVDLSSGQAYADPDLYRAMVAALQRAIRALHERDQQKTNPTYPQALSEMYFGPPSAYETLESGWRRPGMDVDYPPYRALDFFAILSRQAANAAATIRPEALSAVVDASVLDGIVGPTISLHETVCRLKDRVARLAKGGMYQLRWDTRSTRDRAHD